MQGICYINAVGDTPSVIFAMYVRSSIPEQDETSQSQLFLGVGFDFYGKKKTSKFNLVNFIGRKFITCYCQYPKPDQTIVRMAL